MGPPLLVAESEPCTVPASCSSPVLRTLRSPSTAPSCPVSTLRLSASTTLALPRASSASTSKSLPALSRIASPVTATLLRPDARTLPPVCVRLCARTSNRPLVSAAERAISPLESRTTRPPPASMVPPACRSPPLASKEMLPSSPTAMPPADRTPVLFTAVAASPAASRPINSIVPPCAEMAPALDTPEDAPAGMALAFGVINTLGARPGSSASCAVPPASSAARPVPTSIVPPASLRTPAPSRTAPLAALIVPALLTRPAVPVCAQVRLSWTYSPSVLSTNFMSSSGTRVEATSAPTSTRAPAPNTTP